MNTKRKILIFSHFSPEMTGWLVFKYRVQSCLQHFDTIVVSNLVKAKKEFSVPDARFHLFEYSAQSSVQRIVQIPKIYRIIQKYKPDLLLFLGASSYGVISWAIRNVPYSIYWDEHPLRISGYSQATTVLAKIKSGITKYLCYATASRAHTVMPNSIFQAQDLIEHNIAPQRIHTVDMGVDKSFISPPRDYRNDPDAPVKIIYTGSILQSRGSEMILDALAMAKSQGAKVQVKIIGATDKQLTYYRNKAVEYKIDDMYSIHARVPGTEVPRILHESDVGLCIWANKEYWQFNPPTKLFEFLVAGLPVLASNIRTHTEYIQDGVSGVIFDYDATDLCKAFVRLWEQRDRLHSMREKATLSGKMYLWDNVEADFLKALNV